MEEYLTPDEIAERLRVTGKTVRQWCRLGKLKAIRAGKQWRVTPGDLHTFLHQHEEIQTEPHKPTT